MYQTNLQIYSWWLPHSDETIQSVKKVVFLIWQAILLFIMQNRYLI